FKNYLKMKKIHLIAAAAALLLSGGVFMKANQENNQLFDANLEALTTMHETIVWIGEGSTVMCDKVLSEVGTRVYAYGKGRISGREIPVYYVVMNRCVYQDNRQCYGAQENDTEYWDDDYVGCIYPD
ncbi:MAG: hypothetical protein IKI25_10965, partial [Bacteroidales bacterium]|nr:hypothetical protein [Bacteroidales bacterium]